jgi:hypothetical protein
MGELCGCAQRKSLPGHRSTVVPAAVVGGQAISRSDVRRYAEYTQRFFAWAHHDALVGALTCPGASASPACATFYSQVLARLIEESVVMRYAIRHHLSLSQADASRIDDEMIRFEGDRSSNASFFSAVHADRGFVRAVLGRQLLIEKVEAAIVPLSATVGPTLHLREIVLPYSNKNQGSQRLSQAAGLLRGNHDKLNGERTKVRWEAVFRLDADVRSALARVRPGQWAGPFARRDSVIVFQLIARQFRRYGRPARVAIETQFFRDWLDRRLTHLVVHCLNPSGFRVACPA